MLGRATPERVTMFSDGVFAVLITVLVLELRPPALPTYGAFLSLWPTWLSYAVSYLFIALVWINLHYLWRYATEATPRLLWFNFAHLFSMSLLPVSTAWMALSRVHPAGSWLPERSFTLDILAPRNWRGFKHCRPTKIPHCNKPALEVGVR